MANRKPGRIPMAPPSKPHGRPGPEPEDFDEDEAVYRYEEQKRYQADMRTWNADVEHYAQALVEQTGMDIAEARRLARGELESSMPDLDDYDAF